MNTIYSVGFCNTIELLWKVPSLSLTLSFSLSSLYLSTKTFYWSFFFILACDDSPQEDPCPSEIDEPTTKQHQ